MIKFDGFDELENTFKKMSDNAKNLDGSHEVNFEELFTTSFMAENTKFDDMQKFLDDFNPEMSNEEFQNIQQTENWETHVKSNSKFDSWDDMIGTAGEEYAARKLFDGI